MAFVGIEREKADNELFRKGNQIGPVGRGVFDRSFGSREVFFDVVCLNFELGECQFHTSRLRICLDICTQRRFEVVEFRIEVSLEKPLDARQPAVDDELVCECTAGFGFGDGMLASHAKRFRTPHELDAGWWFSQDIFGFDPNRRANQRDWECDMPRGPAIVVKVKLVYHTDRAGAFLWVSNEVPDLFACDIELEGP